MLPKKTRESALEELFGLGQAPPPPSWQASYPILCLPEDPQIWAKGGLCLPTWPSLVLWPQFPLTLPYTRQSPPLKVTRWDKTQNFIPKDLC